ncbi:hypothetical protein CBR_g3157 [Chara braunii]|uniref:AB hydrolase-1 domain-containing protein n=1 Tax=Chara braunii TaxID=69332 RepID=A0A388KF37_CHABU|nr:hypothetical protein CBR_g3157 [Chara braunii]|eukprot:GBG68616.1 hypothetical protein CBR_g3157 [Chara braunii]
MMMMMAGHSTIARVGYGTGLVGLSHHERRVFGVGGEAAKPSGEKQAPSIAASGHVSCVGKAHYVSCGSRGGLRRCSEGARRSTVTAAAAIASSSSSSSSSLAAIASSPSSSSGGALSDGHERVNACPYSLLGGRRRSSREGRRRDVGGVGDDDALRFRTCQTTSRRGGWEAGRSALRRVISGAQCSARPRGIANHHHEVRALQRALDCGRRSLEGSSSYVESRPSPLIVSAAAAAADVARAGVRSQIGWRSPLFRLIAPSQAEVCRSHPIASALLVDRHSQELLRGRVCCSAGASATAGRDRSSSRDAAPEETDWRRRGLTSVIKRRGLMGQSIARSKEPDGRGEGGADRGGEGSELQEWEGQSDRMTGSPFDGEVEGYRAESKPDACKADELHFVRVPHTDWNIALWRYKPYKNCRSSSVGLGILIAPSSLSSNPAKEMVAAATRKHPVLLLAGVGANAFAYDVSPQLSLARELAKMGFDTWICEVRGMGLSHWIKGSGPSDYSVPEDVSDGNAVEYLEKLADEFDRFVPHGDMEVVMSSKSQSSSALASNSSRSAGPPASSESVRGRAMSVVEKVRKTVYGSKAVDVVNGRASAKSQQDKDKEKVESLSGTRTGSTDIGSRLEELRHRLVAVLGSVDPAPRLAQLRDQIANSVGAVELPLLPSIPTLPSMPPMPVMPNMPKIPPMPSMGSLSLLPSLPVLQVSSLRDRLSVMMMEGQKNLELAGPFDWDFDSYLEGDLPAAIEYVVRVSRPDDGKVIAVGHSMGGILLYTAIGRKSLQSKLAAVVTLASALDYAVSDSILKLLLPLDVPVVMDNIPAVPLGLLARLALPLITRPPYTLGWIRQNVSARNAMDPETVRQLLMYNFCSIPVKLLGQLASVFRPGGLTNRDGSKKYMDGLADCPVPVLAFAGDEDTICPPAAVEETISKLPAHLAEYVRVGGGMRGHHYGHYDFLCGRHAKTEVFPVIERFLVRHDRDEHLKWAQSQKESSK